MKTAVKIPKLGLTIEEASLSRWEKAEGDQVEADEVIAVVEADKATYDIVAPVAGKLVRLVAESEDALPVGAEIAVIES